MGDKKYSLLQHPYNKSQFKLSFNENLLDRPLERCLPNDDPNDPKRCRDEARVMIDNRSLSSSSISSSESD